MCMVSKRKLIFFILGILIGVTLTLFLTKDIFEKSIAVGMQKSEFSQSNSPAKLSNNNYEKTMLLTTKEYQSTPLPMSENIRKLEEDIQTVLDHEHLMGAISGISVRKMKGDQILFANHGDTRLRPASNMKILTTIAALETLGPNYQFSTEINTNGTVEKGVLDGDLYLVGKGDPTLQKEDFDELAKSLNEQGIQAINGAIIADDHWYDDVRYSQDLNWSDEFNYTGSAISALTVSPNDEFLSGSVIVDIYPADQIGEKPRIDITPETNYVTIENRAKTVNAGQPLTLTDEREHGSNKLIIEGNIPMNGQHYQRWRSVWEPTGYALDVFKNSLTEQGIEYNENKTQQGNAPDQLKNLVTKKSIPLKEIILLFMKLSNNGLGEVLVKEMGKVVNDEGSWDQGLEVMEEELEQLGMNTEDVVLRDGSGMSQQNLISASVLTSILVNIQDKSWFSHFKKSLPIAGEVSHLVGGTLSDRLADEATKGNVKAKTGTLKGVSTLSGYVTTKDEEELAFSILLNNYNQGLMADIQDEIVTILAEAQLKE